MEFQNMGIAGPTAQAETGSELQSTEPAPTPSWDRIAKTASSSLNKICGGIEAAAKENSLPVRFFTRLIWQESRFDPSQVSPAGAQGIAQFMPPTAAARGLADPFDPVTALQESASYLRELRNTFGNLGLVAAAYNAGATA
jgi:soluble lytic murein transglycosylase-like protein